MFIWTALLGIGFTLCVQHVETARTAKDGELSFMGWFMNNNLHSCTLMVITENKFATAAHCLVMWKNNVKIRYIDLNRAKACAGSTKRSAGQCEVIKEYKTSPKYGCINGTNILLADIGVGYLEQPFRLSRKIQPIPVISRDPQVFRKSWNDIVSRKKECLSAGWNLIEQTADYSFKIFRSNSLQVSRVRPWKDCLSVWPMYADELIPKGSVCATNATNDLYVTGEEGSVLYCQGHVYAVLSSAQMFSQKSPAHFYLVDNYFGELMSASSSIRGIKTLHLLSSIMAYVAAHIFCKLQLK